MKENNNAHQNNNTNQNNNDYNIASSDFSNELKSEKDNLDAEKFAQRQEQYKQILQQPEQTNFEDENPYIWRIGFGRRLGAYIIDKVFVCLLFLIVAVLTGVSEKIMDLFGSDFSLLTDPTKREEIILLMTKSILPLMLAVTFLYYSLEVIFAQSLGKMLLGMQIGDANKKFASYSKLLMRLSLKLSDNILSLLFMVTSLKFLETFSSVCEFVFFVGCFFVLSQKKQGLHDIIAKTAVYFKDELIQLSSTEIEKI